MCAELPIDEWEQVPCPPSPAAPIVHATVGVHRRHGGGGTARCRPLPKRWRRRPISRRQLAYQCRGRADLLLAEGHAAQALAVAELAFAEHANLGFAGETRQGGDCRGGRSGTRARRSRPASRSCWRRSTGCRSDRKIGLPAARTSRGSARVSRRPTIPRSPEEWFGEVVEAVPRDWDVVLPRRRPTSSSPSSSQPRRPARRAASRSALEARENV